MADAEDVQALADHSDRGLTNGLPLVEGDEVPIWVPNDIAHGGSRLVAAGHANVGVPLGIIEQPKHGNWIVIRTGGRTIDREGSFKSRRDVAGDLRGGIAWAKGRPTRTDDRGSYDVRLGGVYKRGGGGTYDSAGPCRPSPGEGEPQPC
jgi:hypothetical protein